MTKSEEMRTTRYRICRQTCRELEAKLREEKNAEVVTSTKRMLYTFRQAVAFMDAEIQVETGFETL